MNTKVLLLAALAVMTLSAGCIDADAVATFDEVNATEAGERATISASALDEAAGQAIENGTSEPTIRQLPFDVERGDKYVRSDSGVYAFEQRTVGTINVTNVRATADITDRQPTVPYEALSDRDRDVVQAAVGETDNEGEVAVGLFYRPAELERSVFADNSSIRVAVDGAVYTVTIEDRTERTREQYVYEATERVAESTKSYGKQLIEERAFTLSSPPEGSEKVVDEAVNSGGYYGEETDGFAALEERFDEEDAVLRDEHRGDWLVRYNGRLYWATLRS